MMTRKKNRFKKLKKYIPYILTGVITLALVSIGSIDKKDASASLNIDAFAGNNYKVSIDQVSGLYVVADLSDALSLASAPDVANNYMVATSLYDSGQSSMGKLEKPPITNITFSRGVVEYVVSEGENMDTIASKFGVSTDQIRWSNGKKNTDVAVGDTLYIPSVSGIVYTVKSGDTVESIVEKYGSTSAEIIALNDLEVSGISEGMRILLKDGSLPEKERPEYVAPVQRTTTYTYTYLGNSYSRQNLRIIATGFFADSPGNPGVRGNCTWYAWYWRATDPRSLGALGREGRNANTWNYNYSYRGVGNTPVVGAVFQTPYGGRGYGHVDVVTALNPDGSIEIEEMNYAGYAVVNAATIPADQVGSFNYIYQITNLLPK